MSHCQRHFDEPVAGICRTCGNPFCDRCLVFAFGTKKPPYCVGCTLHASGVRNGGRVLVTTAPSADLAPNPAGADRRTMRAERRAEKASTRSGRGLLRRNRAATSDEVPLVDAPTDAFVPAPGQLNAHRYSPTGLARPS